MTKVAKVLATVAILVALAATAAAAHADGPHYGDKYDKNYYPKHYFPYCEPDGTKYYGKTKASRWCDTYYIAFREKWEGGKKYYYVHVFFDWHQQDDNPLTPLEHTQNKWFYCQLHKYDDPHSSGARPSLKCYTTYKPEGWHYWESFNYQPPPPVP